MNPLNQVVLQDVKKSFWEILFGWKNLLIFMCHTMKFQNCHHTNLHTLKFNIDSNICQIFSILLMWSTCSTFFFFFWLQAKRENVDFNKLRFLQVEYFAYFLPYYIDSFMLIRISILLTHFLKLYCTLITFFSTYFLWCLTLSAQLLVSS